MLVNGFIVFWRVVVDVTDSGVNVVPVDAIASDADDEPPSIGIPFSSLQM